MNIEFLSSILENKKKGIKFSRTMGLSSSTILGMGAIMGAGIYILIGLAADKAGSAVWLSYLLCGVLAYLSVLMYADLSRMITTSGGGYVYAYHLLGPFWGFITGWHLALGSIFACAIYAQGFAIYSTSLFSDSEATIWINRGIAVAFTWTLTITSIRGSKGGNSIQQVLTLGNVFILLIIAGIAFGEAKPQNLSPLLGHGTEGIFGAIGVIYLSFFGYQLIANNSEEIIEPSRTVPLAMKLSLIISLIIYLTIIIAAVLAVSWSELAATSAPLALVAKRTGGNFGLWLVSLGGLLASGAALSSTLLGQSRQIYAMGRDRLLMQAMGHLHPKHGIPYFAFVTGSVLVSLVILFLQTETIVRIANFCFLVSMLPLSFALAKLHRQKISEGEVVGLVRRIIPWASLLANLSLLLTVGVSTLLVGNVILIIGLLVFILYSRSSEFRGKTGKSFALVEDDKPVLFFGDRRILVPMANPQTQKPLLVLSESLLRHDKKGGEIVAMYVSMMSLKKDAHDSNSYEAIDSVTENALVTLSAGAALLEDKSLKFFPLVRASHSLPLGVVHCAKDEKCSLIVMGFSNDSKAGSTVMDQVLFHTKIDTIFLKTRGQMFAPKKIVVALGGKPDNLGLMVQLACSLANRFRGEICFLSIVPTVYEAKQRELTNRILIKAIQKNTAHTIYRAEMVTSDNPFETLITKTKDFDLLIAGTARAGIREKQVFGNFSIALAEEAECSVALIYKVATPKKWMID